MDAGRWDAADVDRRERVIGLGLAAWAVGSVVAGAALARAGRTAAGRQHLVWGAVDGAIAARGLLVGFARRAADDGMADDGMADDGTADDRTADDGTADDRTADDRARRLRRLLLVNAALDAGYVAVGLALRSGRLRPGAEQDGAAVVVQGGFLLAFDLWHAGRLRRPPAR